MFSLSVSWYCFSEIHHLKVKLGIIFFHSFIFLSNCVTALYRCSLILRLILAVIVSHPWKRCLYRWHMLCCGETQDPIESKISFQTLFCQMQPSPALNSSFGFLHSNFWVLKISLLNNLCLWGKYRNHTIFFSLVLFLHLSPVFIYIHILWNTANLSLSKEQIESYHMIQHNTLVVDFLASLRNK